MKKKTLAALAYISSVSAHGYVKNITIDNTIWPGLDPHQDYTLGAKRVVFGNGRIGFDGMGPLRNMSSPDQACNTSPVAPELIASARAGSDMTFQYTDWITNHKGPMQTYMAPYSGDVKNVDVTKLKFFKIDEAGFDKTARLWASDKMIKRGNKWTTTIPCDIKPGKYVVRHETIALHFVDPTDLVAWGQGGPGAQVYVTCVNVDLTGNGNATPEGVSFPGPYIGDVPGIHFNIYTTPADNYIIPCPPLYVPKTQRPTLPPKPMVTVSPMGTPEADKAYCDNIKKEDDSVNTYGPWINFLFPTEISVRHRRRGVGFCL